MRYPADRKPATRRRILEAASQAFRERGVAETGVDEVMRRAGLTHGGFYIHFRGKADLVAEACTAAFAEAVPNLSRIGRLPTAAARARLLIDSYLAPHHRDHRGSGCLIVGVAADMARLTGAARAGYSRAFNEHLERLAAALRLARDPHENRQRVTLLLSALVGALLCARAVDDHELSDEILRSTRRRLKAHFVEETSLPASRRSPEIRPSHDLLTPL